MKISLRDVKSELYYLNMMNGRNSCVNLAIVFLLLSLCSAYVLDDFKTKLFKFSYPPDGLYDIDFGFSNVQGMLPLAFGDLNGDKFTDVIFTTADRKALKFFVFSRAEGMFDLNKIRPFIAPEGSIISGVSILEWKGENMADLLISFSQNDTISFGVYSQIENFNFTLTGTLLQTMKNTLPFIADINGDFYQDIIFINDQGERVVVLGNASGNARETVNFSTFIDTSEKCLQNKALLPFSSPHSSAILDLNGDCKTDLFFTSGNSTHKFHEIWIRTDYKGLYCLTSYEEVDKDSSQVTFSDFDRDGRIDMIYASGKQLIFKKNTLPTLTEGDIECVRPDPSLESRMFGSVNTTRSEKGCIMELPTGVALYSDSIYPATVRVADYNIDGFPDILFTVKNISSNISHTYLCLNDEGKFYPLEQCQQIGEESILGAFFDFDEDGKADIMLVKHQGGKIETNSYYQYFNRDSFFLKVLQLQGTGYGEVYYGAEFKYIYTDLEGKRHVGIGLQTPQNAHSSLCLPYGLIGIGRSSNYIEHLHITYPVTLSPNSKVWSPIIPNSQIIIKAENSGASNWKIELFVNPSSKISIIVVIVALLLIGLLFIIVILYFKEKKEDEATGMPNQFIRI